MTARSIVNKKNDIREDSKPQSRQSLKSTPSAYARKIIEAKAYDKSITEKNNVNFEVVGQRPFSKQSNRNIMNSRPETAEKLFIRNQNSRQSKRSEIAKDQQELEKKEDIKILSRPDSKQSEMLKKVKSENALKYSEVEEQAPESRASYRSKFLDVEKPESSKSNRSKLSKSPQILELPASQAGKSRQSELKTGGKLDSLKIYIKELEDLLRDEKIKRISSGTKLKKFLETK